MRRGPGRRKARKPPRYCTQYNPSTAMPIHECSDQKPSFPVLVFHQTINMKPATEQITANVWKIACITFLKKCSPGSILKQKMAKPPRQRYSVIKTGCQLNVLHASCETFQLGACAGSPLNSGGRLSNCATLASNISTRVRIKGIHADRREMGPTRMQKRARKRTRRRPIRRWPIQAAPQRPGPTEW